MAIATEEMINSWIEFAEKAANPKTTGFSRQDLNDFSMKLRAFNDDPNNEESRPFFFIHREVDTLDPIAEDGLNVLLLKADASGLAGQFEKVRHPDGRVDLYFSHAVAPFATALCDEFGYGYASLGANGLCAPGFAFAGITTATPERMKSSIVDAQVFLVSSV
jgi:hypothetical protein